MKFYAADPDRFVKTAVTGMFVAIAFGAFGGAAWGQGGVKTKFDAWELRCDTPAGETSEKCALIQTVRAEDTANVSLGVMMVKPKEAKNGVLRIIAPLNVFLLNGVSLKIDQTDIGRAAFSRCAPSGCLADMAIEDTLLEQLKNGKIAILVIYLTPYEGVRHLVMLKGFKDGYERLR